jgi:predicted dehydrogenase
MKKLKLGVIGGLGRQGKKLLNIVRNVNSHDILYVYYLHRQYEENIFDKTVFSIDELFSCDAIIIASPNNTHTGYIKYLFDRDYPGYVFCEKPIANSLKELAILDNLPVKYKEKILFDFNLRFNNHFYNDFYIDELGNLLYISIIDGHGLAYQKEYEMSWRNSPEKNINGIIENVLIHYIDLFMYFGGQPTGVIFHKGMHGPFSNVFDTVHYSANYQYNNNIFCADVFLSYSIPCISCIKMVFDNGFIEYGKNIVIRYPRETFNSNGNFIQPGIKKIIKKSIGDIWTDSQINAINFFIRTVQKNDPIDLKQYNSSLKSTEYLLKNIY